MLERHEEGIRTLERFDHKTFYIISVLVQFLTHTPKKFENSIGDSLIITQFYLVHQHHFDGQYVDLSQYEDG